MTTHKMKIVGRLSPRNVVSFRLRTHLPLAQSSRLIVRDKRAGAVKRYASHWRSPIHATVAYVELRAVLFLLYVFFFHPFFSSVNHWRPRRRCTGFNETEHQTIFVSDF